MPPVMTTATLTVSGNSGPTPIGIAAQTNPELTFGNEDALMDLILARMTSIEWTDHTWNPIVGCEKIASECDHCYAAWVATPTLESIVSATAMRTRFAI